MTSAKLLDFWTPSPFVTVTLTQLIYTFVCFFSTPSASQCGRHLSTACKPSLPAAAWLTLRGTVKFLAPSSHEDFATQLIRITCLIIFKQGVVYLLHRHKLAFNWNLKTSLNFTWGDTLQHMPGVKLIWEYGISQCTCSLLSLNFQTPYTWVTQIACFTLCYIIMIFVGM